MSRFSRTCKIAGCSKTVWSREMCRSHYDKWYRNGDPLYVSNKTPPGAPLAFLESLPMTGEGCVIWPYSTNSMGYGNIRISGKTLSVCRLLCEKINGPAQSMPVPIRRCAGAHSYGEGSGAEQRPCQAVELSDGTFQNTCEEPCSFVMRKGGSELSEKAP